MKNLEAAYGDIFSILEEQRQALTRTAEIRGWYTHTSVCSFMEINAAEHFHVLSTYNPDYPHIVKNRPLTTK